MVYHVLMHAILTFRVCGACRLRYQMAGALLFVDNLLEWGRNQLINGHIEHICKP